MEIRGRLEELDRGQLVADDEAELGRLKAEFWVRLWQMVMER